jgi:hypothetical protein
MLGRGPVWSDTLDADTRCVALHDLLERLRKHHRVVIATPDQIGHDDPLRARGWLALVAHGTMARLTLPDTPEILRAGLHGKWRNRLVRAEGAGITVRLGPMPDDARHWLLEREAEQAKSRGYKRPPPAFALAWRAAGGARATLLATAHDADGPLAGMLFLRHGTSASYHVGWVSARGRACDAHRLLLFRAACKLASKGHAALDLGTLDTVTTPGLARFKLGSGAHPVTLGATRIKAPGTTLFARLAADGPARATLAPAQSSQHTTMHG